MANALQKEAPGTPTNDSCQHTHDNDDGDDYGNYTSDTNNNNNTKIPASEKVQQRPCAGVAYAPECRTPDSRPQAKLSLELQYGTGISLASETFCILKSRFVVHMYTRCLETSYLLTFCRVW